MTRPRYRTVTRTQGNNRALKEGAVRPGTFEFEFEEVPVLVHAFRRMVRTLEFDICEMALTTYLCARAHGVKFTALPIFLVRNFHHGAIARNLAAGPLAPEAVKDRFEGHRVGVNRGYTVTTGVWARAILQEEFGVDLSRVTWVRSGDEHVEAYRAPANVVPLGEGRSLQQGLLDGDLVAAVGADLDHPDLGPLIPDPFEAGVAALESRGFYPINHLVVVRDALLDENPDLAADLFETFAESKRRYVEALRTGRVADPTPVDRVHLRALEVMEDPLPYGVEPNRQVLEELIAHAVRQQILPAPVAVDHLFSAATRGLTG